MHIQTHDLAIGYQDHTILDNISITPPAHEISVILGANGCGKSTLLKTFSRLLKPKSGIVTLDRQDIHTLPPKKLAQSLSLLPQSPLVPEGMRVYDLVAQGRYPYLKMMGTLSEKDHQMIQDALAMMHIEDLKDRYIHELSGGQRQRVWIALALAQDPEVLLLDEPTTYLDISYQIELLDALMTLNKQKKTTIIMVLHDINLAARYSSYVYAIAHDSIYEGMPLELITPALMQEVYHLNCQVVEDPVSHTPLIIPLGKYHQDLE